MNFRTIFSSCLLAAMLTGCSSSAPSDMTKAEADALRHPSKTIPKEAVEGMKHMGEMMKKQREQNEREGVDSQGLPIKKKGQDSAPPPNIGASNGANNGA